MIQFHKQFTPACPVPGSGLGTNDAKMAPLPARSPQPIRGDPYTVAHRSGIPVGQSLERRERMETDFRESVPQQACGDPAE